MDNVLKEIKATIKQSETTSQPFSIRPDERRKIVGIDFPSAMTGTSISLEINSGGKYKKVYQDGVEIAIDFVDGVNFLYPEQAYVLSEGKIRIVSSNAEATDREIIILTTSV